MCGESIMRSAKKCKHCGEYLDGSNSMPGSLGRVNRQNNVGSAPEIWNPTAAVNWSIFCLPLGALLHHKNAKTMDRPDEARANLIWFVILIIACIAATFFSNFTTDDTRIFPFLILVIPLLLWYGTTARKQIAHVKESWGKNYDRRGWFFLLLTCFVIQCFAAYVILMCSIIVASRYQDINSSTAVSEAFSSHLDSNLAEHEREVARIMAGRESEDAVVNQSTGLKSFSVGETVRTDTFETTITSAETMDKVGSEFMAQNASDGGLYVAIRWNYKNVSSMPVGMFDQPSLYLVAPDGTKYKQDIAASAYYAAENDTDTKVFSDLNPGIKVNSASVFEVSREAFSKPSSQWGIFVDTDSDYMVRLKP
jgi:hypothetical protein